MPGMALADALAALDAAGGRLSIVDGRVQVDVDRELSDGVWDALAAHKRELLVSLGGKPAQAETLSPLSPFSPFHPAQERDLPVPAGVDCCDRCGSTETTDSTIHGGQSVRRDCRVCGRFRKFVVWHGTEMP
jgi:hypothetical protein